MELLQKFVVLSLEFSTIIIIAGILFAIFFWVLTYDGKELKEVRRLEHVVNLANTGNENARLVCEHEPRITKSIVYDETIKKTHFHYSVSIGAILRPFGF